MKSHSYFPRLCGEAKNLFSTISGVYDFFQFVEFLSCVPFLALRYRVCICVTIVFLVSQCVTPRVPCFIFKFKNDKNCF